MMIAIREMGASDRTVWADMRAALWQEESFQAHALAIEGLHC
jgi:hypothetical protein